MTQNYSSFSNFKSLKILYFNAQSLLNKINALNILLSSANYDIICITETWLGGKVIDSLLLNNSQYTLIRCDRDSRRGGGVCFFIANHISYKIVSKSSIHNVDLVCVDIFDIYSLKTLRLINIYCPPNFRNIDMYTEFLDYLSDLSIIDFSVVIVGDFNVPNICRQSSSQHYSSSATERAISDFIHSHQLTQHVNFPTRHNNILDLLFTNVYCNENLKSISALPPFGTDKQSDHNAFEFTLSIGHSAVEKNPSPRRNFYKANYSHINSYFASLDWNLIFTQCYNAEHVSENKAHNASDFLNCMYSTFMHVVHEAIELFVPLHTPKHMYFHLPKHIQSLYDYRVQLWRDKNTDKAKLLRCSQKLNKEIRKFHKNRERKNLTTTDLKTKFKYCSSFLKTKSKQIPTLTYESKLVFTEKGKSNALANTFKSIFNNQFYESSDIKCEPNGETLEFIPINPSIVCTLLKKLHLDYNDSPDQIPEIFLQKCCSSLCWPLTFLFQYALMSSKIPDIWKKSIISPIPKINSPSNPLDFRPVSLLCPTSKVFEKIIFTKLAAFLERKNIIPKCQHGFRKKMSVTTNLIETYEDISLATDIGLLTDVIYFDLAKAFDTVPTSRLVKKLSTFGVKGPLLSLIEYYLSNRTFTVRVGKTFSEETPVLSGVPQGSVSGPILFIAYISDLPLYCETNNVTIKLFADDLKAYSSSHSADSLNVPLQNFIDKFIKYCELNGLTIAMNKCEVLHIGNKNKRLPYSILNNNIKKTQANQPVRDLGLYFTADLKWHTHIDITSKKARRISFAILKAIQYSSPEILINLFKVYVRPIIEFASNVCNPYLLKDINKLEKIQKDFLKIVHKRVNFKIYKNNPLSSLSTYNELLFIYQLESLEQRRLKSDLILFHKHLNGNAKINNQTSYTVRESNTRGEKYKIFPNVCKTIARHNAFFVRTSRIYSKLPIEVRNCNDSMAFKSNLDQFCFTKYLKCTL